MGLNDGLYQKRRTIGLNSAYIVHWRHARLCMVGRGSAWPFVVVALRVAPSDGKLSTNSQNGGAGVCSHWENIIKSHHLQLKYRSEIWYFAHTYLPSLNLTHTYEESLYGVQIPPIRGDSLISDTGPGSKFVFL